MICGVRRSHHPTTNSPQSLPEPQNLSHLHLPPSLAPLGACSAPLAASEPPCELHPAGNSASAATHIPNPSPRRHLGITDSKEPAQLPVFPGKHPQGAPQPDPPAPGDAICRSSAARTPNGKQPQGPGEGIRDEPLRGRAAAAARPLSPPKACSIPQVRNCPGRASPFWCREPGWKG